LRPYLLLLFLCYFSAKAQPFKSESDFKKYFSEHSTSLAPVEGLWQVSTRQESFSNDTLYDEKTFNATVGLVKQDTLYVSYDMKGNPYNVYFTTTDVEKVYLYRIFLKEINKFTKTDAVISQGKTMEYKYDFPDEYLKIMLGETYEKGERVVNRVKWTKVFPK
jgi:hypothetical protein